MSRDRARAYGAYFETLRPDNVERLRDLATSDMRFKDPFNDVRGIERVIRVLQNMFEDASDVAFVIREYVCDDDRALLRWDFTCRPRSRFVSQPWPIEGVSLVRFDPAAKVREHVDYWDAAAQVYARLPILGAAVRAVARRLGTGDPR